MKEILKYTFKGVLTVIAIPFLIIGGIGWSLIYFSKYYDEEEDLSSPFK